MSENGGQTRIAGTHNVIQHPNKQLIFKTAYKETFDTVMEN
jgi:hypothetical protein